MTQVLQLMTIGITLGAVYGMVGLGFTIVYNATDTINFAQGEFVMLGGMLTAIMLGGTGLPLVTAAAIAVVGVCLLGALVHVLTISRVGNDQLRVILMTLALGIVMRSLVLAIWGKDPRYIDSFTAKRSFAMGDVVISTQSLWVLGLTAVAVGGLFIFYKKSRLGRGMIATSLDAGAASLMGINIKAMTILAFTLSAGFGALAGIAVAPLSATVYSIGFTMGLMGFVAAALGGMGSVVGTLIGGVIIGLTEAFAAGYLSSGYKTSLALAVGVVILLMAPRGILGGRLR